jgi:hypothetical protein
MKKFLLFIFASIALSSCIDENPKGQLSEDNGYSTATKLELNAVASLYNYIGGNAESQGIMGTSRGVYDFNTFSTDEAMLPVRGGDWYDGGFWQNLYYHTWTASDVSLLNTWNYLYKVIVLCNNGLSHLQQHKSLLTDDKYTALTAEVRGLRAMFYYYLMDLWGRVPIVTMADENLENVKQSSRSDVFKFVVSELQYVEPLLAAERSNTEGNYYGRITRPVVDFLLAKIALNAEIYSDDNWTDGSIPDGKSIYFTVDGKQMNAWETVIAYCDKLSAEGYSLETNYSTNFAVHNEYSKENIFIIPMDKALYANQFWYLFRSRHYNHGSAIGMDSENGTSATVSTVRTYGYGTDSIDTRYAINFYSDTLRVDGKIVKLDDGTPLVYMPLEVKPDVTGSKYEKTAGARMSKYEIDRTAYADGKLQNNDIVLFRYADALLMKSEAKVRNGEDGSAELNMVRSRVNMPYRQATLKTILDERLLELVWEGWRRQDLIRFGMFNKTYDMRPQIDGESDGYTTVFPIPQNAISLNKNLSQNPDYK